MKQQSICKQKINSNDLETLMNLFVSPANSQKTRPTRCSLFLSHCKKIQRLIFQALFVHENEKSETILILTGFKVLLKR